MAHELKKQSDGTHAYVGREAGWHHLGNTFGRALTADEIKANIEAFNQPVEKVQRVNPRTGEDIRSWDVFNVVTNEWLGTVGERATIYQKFDSLAEFDNLLGTGGAHYETAGVLGNGERYWVLANLDSWSVLGIDPHKTYLLMTHSHDGSVKYTEKEIVTRVVCANTLAVAQSESGVAYTRKATKGIANDVKKHHRTVADYRAQGLSFGETLNELAQRAVKAEDLKKVVAELFGVSGKAWDAIPTVTQNRITNVFELFEDNDKNAFPEFRGTAYNALNSITEYVDHFVPVRISGAREAYGVTELQARAESALFGDGAKFKSEALNTILELTANAPRVNGIKSYSYANTQGGSVLDDILNNIS